MGGRPSAKARCDRTRMRYQVLIVEDSAAFREALAEALVSIFRDLEL